MILLVDLACPALDIINAVPVNLSSNYNLLRQTGDDLTSASLKKHCRCTNVYLIININAFLKINTQVYIF
jgi:hypothetical protein